MEELILIVGPAGAGKTTAVTTVCDTPAGSTCAAHGCFELPGGKPIGLCALAANTVPSHDLRSRASGIVVLVDGRAADAPVSVARYAAQYRTHVGNHTLVVGITQTAVPGQGLSLRTARLLQMRSTIPIVEIDVHDKLQMSVLLRLLLDRAEAWRTQHLAD